ncbi:hypothetical protein JCM8547_004696 [Rhodosporidiobolus lusitaniae]
MASPAVPPPRARLTALSSETLDRIFALIPSDERPPVPICKALLRHPAPALLSSAANLETLTLTAESDVAALLAVLPSPKKLKNLTIRTTRLPHVDTCQILSYADRPGVSSSFVNPLSRFTNLTHLNLACPCDLPSLFPALRATSLEHLSFDPPAKDAFKPGLLDLLISGEGGSSRRGGEWYGGGGTGG